MTFVKVGDAEPFWSDLYSATASHLLSNRDNQAAVKADVHQVRGIGQFGLEADLRLRSGASSWRSCTLDVNGPDRTFKLLVIAARQLHQTGRSRIVQHFRRLKVRSMDCYRSKKAQRAKSALGWSCQSGRIRCTEPVDQRARCASEYASYQATQSGFAIASCVTTSGMDFPSSRFLIGTSSFLPVSV